MDNDSSWAKLLTKSPAFAHRRHLKTIIVKSATHPCANSQIPEGERIQGDEKNWGGKFRKGLML